jgi:ribosomal protein S18 acetylase RimI-like enzyme
MTDFLIRPISPNDNQWISQLMVERWGSEIVVVHNKVYKPADLPGLIAVEQNNRIGLITYQIEEDECEIVTLDSLKPSLGVGKGLIDEVCKIAKVAGCRRVWVITMNDNIEALRFYQKRGFTLVAIHRNAVNRAREMKPQIAKVGNHGIPIQDEIELEMILDQAE